MPEPKDAADSDGFKGFTNEKCPFLRCHEGVNREFNCTFCYCPLYFIECPGPYELYTDKHGLQRKDCTNCTLPHDGYAQSWAFIQKWMERPVIWDGQPQSKDKIMRMVAYLRGDK